MGRRQGQGNTNKTKNKKKSNSMKPSSNKKGKKRNSNNTGGGKSGSKNSHRQTVATSGETTSTTTTAKQQKQQHSAPPWQVVSTKDMKKNIAAEKTRREIAQDTGQHLTPQQIEMNQLNLQRSTAFLSVADRTLLGWKPFTMSSSSRYRVEFQGAYLHKQLPPRLGAPEVAFLGRSNVGKSSLLNRLIGPSTSSDVARVGKTPGATASVNLYGIFDIRQEQRSKSGSTNQQQQQQQRQQKAVMGLVDLPGFGYAKLAKETQRTVQETAEHYLAQREELALGILLVDIRRIPTVDDKAVLAALFDMGVPIVVVATKVDKLSSTTKVEQALQTINVELGLPDGQPLCISSVTGQGVKDLWRIIMEACEGHVEDLRRKIETGGIADGVEEFHGSSFDEIKAATQSNEFDDDVAYSQGYDWIQDTVMYAEDDDDYYDDADMRIDGANESYYDDDDDGSDYGFGGGGASMDMPSMAERTSIKALRRQAKDMERRGEI